MGFKERQERDREGVRRAILDAARELFVSEGYRNVSIRTIAEKIEHSPGGAMMRLSDRLGPGEDADALARDVLTVTLRGLQSSTALESTFVEKAS